MSQIKRRPRPALSFRAVNRRGSPGYDAGLQKHHLLPLQLLGRSCFASLLADVDPHRKRFDDFRRNGLLLPANEESTLLTGLPMHRGPHRRYNTVVIERVGEIERDWSAHRVREPTGARHRALFRLNLLQRALRRRLLDPIGQRFWLNRKDPLGYGLDFTELDAMADLLWSESFTDRDEG